MIVHIMAAALLVSVLTAVIYNCATHSPVATVLGASVIVYYGMVKK